MSNETFSFVLNGKTISIPMSQVQPELTLSDYIRSQTKWTGTKVSCHEGGCGACTVLLTFNNATTGKVMTRSVNSCLRPLIACNGQTVTTNEALSQGNTFDTVQQQLAAHNGSQCGYCSSGFVIAMHSLLAEHPSPTEQQIEDYFDGHLCRCTGYRPIMSAFKTFSPPKQLSPCQVDKCCRRKREGTLGDLEDLPRPDPLPAKSLDHLLKLKPELTRERMNFRGSDSMYHVVTSETDLQYWLSHYAATKTQTSLIVAQTSYGVVGPNFNPFSATILIAGVASLSGITQNSLGITIMANTTIQDVVTYFETCTGPSSYSIQHLPQFTQYLRHVATYAIRNIASLTGNIMMAYYQNGTASFFPSDILTGLWAINATLQVYNCVTKQSNTVTFDQFFAYDFTGCYVQSIFVPWAASANERFMVYKIAIRRVNAHAFVNAGFKMQVDSNNTVIGQPTFVFGGLQTSHVRASPAESSLVGKNVTSLTVLQGAIAAFSNWCSPDPNAGSTSVAFRKSTATNDLYRFLLMFQPSLPAKLQSGILQWIPRPVSDGAQSYSKPDAHELPASIALPKLEALQQTSGRAVYTDDIPVPSDCLYACLVYCPQANCTIGKLDASQAQAMVPGFVKLYTAADIPPNSNVWENGPILASSQVNFAHQPVGIVLATDLGSAFEAAAMINVPILTSGPIISDIDLAIEKQAFFPPPPFPTTVSRGDVTSAIAAAGNNVYNGTVYLGYQYHFHLENHVALAIPKEDVMEVHCATQMPQGVQQQVAQVLGVPNSKVVAMTKRSGGGFGGKLTSSLFVSAIAAFCAGDQRQPVKFTLGMQDTMRAVGCRGGKRMDYTVAWTPTGQITALKATVYCAAGVNNTDEDGATFVCLQSIDNCYNIPNMQITGVQLKLNLPATAPVRGPGWIPAVSLAEMVISRVCAETGLDGDTVRELNFYQQGDTTIGGMPLTYFSMQTLWAQLKSDAGLTARMAAVAQYNAANVWTKRGLALTPVRFGVGQTGANFDSIVNIYPDGTVGVTHGGCEIGQGINTKVIQAVAYKLGLTEADVNAGLISCHETSTRVTSSMTNVTGGSVASELCCLSVIHACETLNRRLAPLRAQFPTLSWSDFIGRVTGMVELSATGWTDAPVGANPAFNYNSYGCACTEVLINALTGEFQLVRVDLLFDAGRSINPMIDIGQIEGGFMFGVGLNVFERPRWSATTGQALNASTWTYKPPSAFDIPVEMNTTLLKNAPNPIGVLGAKATGEPGVALASSVVAALENAVTAARRQFNPTAPRWVCSELPLTVDGVQQACGITASNYQYS